MFNDAIEKCCEASFEAPLFLLDTGYLRDGLFWGDSTEKGFGMGKRTCLVLPVRPFPDGRHDFRIEFRPRCRG